MVAKESSSLKEISDLVDMSLDEFRRLDILGVIVSSSIRKKPANARENSVKKVMSSRSTEAANGNTIAWKDILCDREAWFSRLLEDIFDIPEQTLQERRVPTFTSENLDVEHCRTAISKLHQITLSSADCSTMPTPDCAMQVQRPYAISLLHSAVSGF
jgi:hypothetical protein